jgi:hypothetical protein
MSVKENVSVRETLPKEQFLVEEECRRKIFISRIHCPRKRSLSEEDFRRAVWKYAAQEKSYSLEMKAERTGF